MLKVEPEEKNAYLVALVLGGEGGGGVREGWGGEGILNFVIGCAYVSSFDWTYKISLLVGLLIFLLCISIYFTLAREKLKARESIFVL